MGMKKTFKNMKECGNHKIIIATVGLADPGDKAAVCGGSRGECNRDNK